MPNRNAFGPGGKSTGSNNIDIGSEGVAGESDKIRIGTVGTQRATFIAGHSCVAVTGAAVVVSSSGQLGVAPSSQRFKDQIKPMDKATLLHNTTGNHNTAKPSITDCRVVEAGCIANDRRCLGKC